MRQHQHPATSNQQRQLVEISCKEHNFSLRSENPLKASSEIKTLANEITIHGFV